MSVRGEDKALLCSAPRWPVNVALHHNKHDPAGGQEVSRVGSGSPIPARPARHHVVVQSRQRAFVKKFVARSPTALDVLICKKFIITLRSPRSALGVYISRWEWAMWKVLRHFFIPIVGIAMRLARALPLGSMRSSWQHVGLTRDFYLIRYTNNNNKWMLCHTAMGVESPRP